MTPAMVGPRIRVFGPERQARGAFDRGRIRETKPIGFPGEGSAVRRVGPLFYWAWAVAPGRGRIAMHPHRGFEILTYVLGGRVAHRDSLGVQSIVDEGGIQLMQAGSGMLHEEETVGSANAFFQLWFEPDLRQALQRPPAYHEFARHQFPETVHAQATVWTLIGPGSPVKLFSDVRMTDVRIDKNGRTDLKMEPGRVLAATVVEGNGSVGSVRVSRSDFLVIQESNDAKVAVVADDGFRFVAVDVPAELADAPVGARPDG